MPVAPWNRTVCSHQMFDFNSFVMLYKLLQSLNRGTVFIVSNNGNFRLGVSAAAMKLVLFWCTANDQGCSVYRIALQLYLSEMYIDQMIACRFCGHCDEM